MRFGRSNWFATTALVSVLCFSGAALGDSAQEEQARKLFREGVALHQSRDYENALEKFRAAYRLWKNPKILANIGTAAWELRRYAIAANAYDRFLQEAPADAPNRGEVEKALREVLPRVGTLEITVTGTPKTVTIDGQSVELARIRKIRVMPGSHDVVAIAENGSRSDQSVTVSAGATVAISLAVDSPDGTNTAPSTTPTKPVPDDKPGTTSVEGAPQRSALPWVLGGVGVASFIASAVLWSMRGSSESKLKSECIQKVCPESSKDEIAKANRLGALSAITFGIGVAGVGSAVYLIAKGPSKKEAPPTKQAFQVYVSGSPHSAGAAFGGRF